MEDVTIQALTNGPLIVKGPVKLVNATGEPIPPGEGPVMALCRCGHSGSKPFCDGSHKKVGFQG